MLSLDFPKCLHQWRARSGVERSTRCRSGFAEVEANAIDLSLVVVVAFIVARPVSQGTLVRQSSRQGKVARHTVVPVVANSAKEKGRAGGSAALISGLNVDRFREGQTKRSVGKRQPKNYVPTRIENFGFMSDDIPSKERADGDHVLGKSGNAQ